MVGTIATIHLAILRDANHIELGVLLPIGICPLGSAIAIAEIAGAGVVSKSEILELAL